MCLFQTGTVRGTLLAVEHMRKDKGGAGGVIINVASAGGKDNNSISFFSDNKHSEKELLRPRP